MARNHAPSTQRPDPTAASAMRTVRPSPGACRGCSRTRPPVPTTHNSQRNVTGPVVNSLHAMSMRQYAELWVKVDPLASSQPVGWLVRPLAGPSRCVEALDALALW